MKIVQLSAIDMTLNNFLENLNKSTLESGYEVICVSSEGPYKEELISKGYSVFNVNIDRRISPISNMKSILELRKLFKTIKPDIVHVHTPIASVLGRVAAKLAGINNIIYTAHGFYFHDDMSEKEYKFYLSVEKYTAKFTTDYLLTQSYEDYETAKKHSFLKDESKIICIGNGIDLDDKYNYDLANSKSYYTLYKEHNLKEEDIIISFIGRLVKEKGILDLLEAFNNMTRKNVKLVIMGGIPQGERDTDTGNAIKQYESNPNIIFTGHVNNANEYLYISDIFCLPSYREGMPRSIIEAMAMKNAIIATNIRGSREEVIHGETGYLVDVASPNQLQGYLEQLIDSKKLLEEMKENGFKRAHELYHEDFVVEKQLNIFQTIEEKVR